MRKERMRGRIAILMLVIAIAIGYLIFSYNKLEQKKTIYPEVNRLPNITIEVEKDTVSADGATFIFRNLSGRKSVRGSEYTIEEYRYNNWFRVETVLPEEEILFDSLAYHIGEETEWSCDWTRIYGSLRAGRYRIVVHVNSEYLAAEFEVV